MRSNKICLVVMKLMNLRSNEINQFGSNKFILLLLKFDQFYCYQTWFILLLLKFIIFITTKQILLLPKFYCSSNFKNIFYDCVFYRSKTSFSDIEYMQNTVNQIQFDWSTRWTKFNFDSTIKLNLLHLVLHNHNHKNAFGEQ